VFGSTGSFLLHATKANKQVATNASKNVFDNTFFISTSYTIIAQNLKSSKQNRVVEKSR